MATSIHVKRGLRDSTKTISIVKWIKAIRDILRLQEMRFIVSIHFEHAEMGKYEKNDKAVPSLIKSLSCFYMKRMG